MYLSLTAEGNSLELASGVPFLDQMAQRSVLDLSELLGAGSWSYIPLLGSQTNGAGAVVPPRGLQAWAGLQPLGPAGLMPSVPSAALPRHLLLPRLNTYC